MGLKKVKNRNLEKKLKQRKNCKAVRVSVKSVRRGARCPQRVRCCYCVAMELL